MPTSIQRLQRFGVLLSAVPVAILAAELIARGFGLGPPLPVEYSAFVPDPHLPYRPRPMAVLQGRSASDEFDFDYRHNSMGLRDSEHSLVKPRGTFRILALGDSYTYGIGARFEETFLKRLERRLNNRPDASQVVEIVKAGVPRYFAEPERMFFEFYGSELAPDLVIVVFLPGDLNDTLVGLDEISVDSSGYLLSRDAGRIGPFGIWMYSHSVVARTLANWTLSVTYWSDVDRHTDPLMPFRDCDLTRKAWAMVEAEYSKMIELAHRIGARIAFVHIPHMDPWPDGVERPATHLGEWCSARGVAFIDVLPAMRTESSRAQLYWPIDGHCTAEGHSVIAECLHSELIAGGLVP